MDGALFIELDLDCLCAAHTAPIVHPADRIMSNLNLGLQSVGLACARMDEDVEVAIQSCNSVAEIRRAPGERENVCTAFLDSVAPVKTVLSGFLVSQHCLHIVGSTLIELKMACLLSSKYRFLHSLLSGRQTE